MTIKETIEHDIKQAMLAGEKTLVTTLRGLKSAILYAEVSSSARDTGLSDEVVTELLQKESKKRRESAALYRQGGNEEKAAAEEQEIEVIAKYLPEQLSEDKVRQLVEQKAAELSVTTLQQMGQLIAAVKQSTGSTADGALIARIVKEYLAS